MKRILAAVAAALGLLVSAGQASASGPADSALQVASQAVASAQGAGAQSGAAQSRPANQNVSVRVQSRGSGGGVTQSNTVASGATATNANAADQSATQAQSDACTCGGGTQAVGQEADSSQAAGALSQASQSGAGNESISVRVQSPGNDGNVSQSNTAASGAAATNANATGQSADQASAGGSGTQAIGQDANSEQAALAGSSAEQTGAKNTNISVRVQSPGDDGDVEQSNTVASAAAAGNLNLTKQDAKQAQAGECTCGTGTQAIGQDATSGQKAAALSSAEQKGASNEHIAVRVQSPGTGGSVTQSNTVASAALAGNGNLTGQKAGQAQSGGGTQAIGQDASSDQGALTVSKADQAGAWNATTPVRVDSKGDDGDVDQSNTVASVATAGNLNGLSQEADQARSGDCRCGWGTQAIGQDAKSHQAAGALSLASQQGGDTCGCRSGGNTHAPVRVDSDGGGGSLSQSNTAASAATAGNLNATKQDADQAQSGGGVQAIGQKADNEQLAVAGSLAIQLGARNESAPVRVDSPGGGGSLEQSNDVASYALAQNLNGLGQTAAQGQAAGGGTAIQAIGQSAKSHQAAIALSAALQLGASNASSPVLVDSHGGGSSVSQSNGVASGAQALNANLTGQTAAQRQATSCRCLGGAAIQALGQSASSAQLGFGASLALQCGGGKDAQGAPTYGSTAAHARGWRPC